MSSVDNTSTAEGETTVSLYPPKILFYEDHPLEGVRYRHALTDVFRVEKESATIVAEPYFFSIINPQDTDIRYEWSLNNEGISTPENKNELFLRTGADQSGIATLSLSIKSMSKIFQETAINLNIFLGK